MIDAIGIVNFEDESVRIEGLSEYRTIPAMSFVGRYRIVDFVISNMINSGIDKIKVMVREKPRSLIDHLDNGMQYNINPKHGFIDVLYPDHNPVSDAYYHDVYVMNDNLEYIQGAKTKYVVIAPSYMICRINFASVIREHERNGADVTCVYKPITDGKKHFLGCHMAKVNVDGRITAIEQNIGMTSKMNIMTEAYVMKREVFVELINEASRVSPLFSFINILSHVLDDIKVYGYEFRDYLVCINSLDEYFRANMEMINYDNAPLLFSDDWPIYTKTNDSAPAFYAKSAHVKNCLIANGSEIYGDLENCILGRGVKIGEGADIKNCLLLPNCEVAPYSHLENVVVDKHAKISTKREILGTPDNLIYIKRRDRV
ncbi:MAG: glucose-1-phosphate adenylyltransferase subunit GlgD [Erysipelotrichaceae bacterium]|nr:glucose-1-phosphate adenylyltransferase subunit GlgD [Erysipelotrichaceae bacterium]